MANLKPYILVIITRLNLDFIYAFSLSLELKKLLVQRSTSKKIILGRDEKNKIFYLYG